MTKTEEKKLSYAYLRKNMAAVLAVIFMLITAVPLVSPLGLPIPLTEKTRAFYETIEELPQGSVIFCVIDSGSVIMHQVTDVMRHIIRKGHKWVQFTSGSVSWAWTDLIMAEIKPDLEAKNYVYGVDYALIGFILGGEVVKSALYSDFKSVVKTDYYGTPIREIPILKDIKDHNYFDLGFFATSGGGQEAWSRQWPAGYPPKILVTAWQFLPAALPFVGEGNVYDYYLCGRSDQAQYQLLTGLKGRVLAETDAWSIANAFLGIEAILINVWIFKDRIFKKKEEVEE